MFNYICEIVSFSDESEDISSLNKGPLKEGEMLWYSIFNFLITLTLTRHKAQIPSLVLLLSLYLL